MLKRSVSLYSEFRVSIVCIYYVQAGLVLRQSYFPESHRAYRIQNAHLKHCVSWGLGDWQPHSMLCVTTPLVDIRTLRVHM
jgi:hypothetical protein